MKRQGAVFLDTLKKSKGFIAAICLSFIGSGIIFYLYSLPLEPFLYAAALISFCGIILFVFTFVNELGKSKVREQMIQEALTQNILPPADTLSEKDYGNTIQLLRDELTKLRNEYTAAMQDEIDYYTVWVHQIKTPIAVMRMKLGADTEDTLDLSVELFRIEQYVDMVLQYIRLGSGSNDLVIKDYPLDDIIREAVRKFAPQFVSKKLRLNYAGTERIIITDKKWFSCILEQILSNAIKYTQAGSISICVENGFLSISDTGIGISAEDIPRVFEKGFTGGNGRLDKCSSGLGLYLCKRAADLLNIKISVESTVGKGSRFSVECEKDFKTNKNIN